VTSSKTQKHDFEHPFYVFKNLIVPKSQHSEAVPAQTSIPLFVEFLIICMLSTVKLYDNTFFKGYKVNDVCLDWLLPAELDTFKLAVSQIPP